MAASNQSDVCKVVLVLKLPLKSIYSVYLPQPIADRIVKYPSSIKNSIKNLLARRILLNFIHDSIQLTESLFAENINLNWQPRSFMIHLLLHLKSTPTKNADDERKLLYKMMKSSSMSANSHGYAVCQGNSAGDNLLRHVISYL